MKFLIEKTNFIYVKLDTLIVKKTIRENKCCSYLVMTYKELCDVENNTCDSKNKDIISKCIPIGSIQFVELFYKIFYGIEKENSIEIPKELRTKEFLKRKYMICKYKSLPRKGNYFVKDATSEKTVSFVGKMSDFYKKYNENEELKSHLFVVSELLNIKAEFRYYIVRGEIKNFTCYKGKCDVEIDKELIAKTIQKLNNIKEFPKSYSFDVMITDKGTSIVEVHTFCGLGIHNYMWDSSLLDAYEDCHQYYINYNKVIEI